jgi:hypothetical protein
VTKYKQGIKITEFQPIIISEIWLGFEDSDTMDLASLSLVIRHSVHLDLVMRDLVHLDEVITDLVIWI